MERMRTKRGNNLPFYKKPKEMSKLEFGIICNYTDFLKKQMASFCVCDTSRIGKLKRKDFDPLRFYGYYPLFGYIRKKAILISALGGLTAERYFITDKGKRRLKELKTNEAIKNGCAQLCRCNNCNNILIDENPQINAPYFKPTGKELNMQQFEDEGGVFWGCPVCQTDEYLTDI